LTDPNSLLYNGGKDFRLRMIMKINLEILSIPPYISTAWRNISSLHIEESELVITLKNGVAIHVPNQKAEILEQIFECHASYLEKEEVKRPSAPSKRLQSPFMPPLGLNFALSAGPDGIEGLGSMMQHSPEHANAPDLPEEMLNQIERLTKAIGIDEGAISSLPKAEPHCNCPYCQVARAISGEQKKVEPESEELVTDDDLSFRDWEIAQIGDKLYSVTNPLDEKESYQVYLGMPVGCTCGQSGCEHIKAVLNS
jgi:hypothetical protein